MANTNRTYYFIDPSNNEVETNDLKQFCVDNDLTYNRMHSVATDPDRGTTHKGYRISPKQDTSVKVKQHGPYCMYNPGLNKMTELFAVRADLAKASGVSSQSIWRMLKAGPGKSVRGWYITADITEAEAAMRDEPVLTEDDI